MKIPLGKYLQQPGVKILDVLMNLKLQPFPKDFYPFSQLNGLTCHSKKVPDFSAVQFQAGATCSQAFPGGPCEMQPALQGKQVIHTRLQ